MMPTSYLFRKGHHIRVSVVTSLGKVFNMDPATHADAPTWVSVLRDKDHPSHIRLPVSEASNMARGRLQISTDTIQYSGSASLYLDSQTIYIGYDDRWLKCDSVNYEETGYGERYTCARDSGPLTIDIKNRFFWRDRVIAEGADFSFRGYLLP